MDILLAQQNYTIGDIEGNVKKILSAIKKAERLKGDLIIFPELCICGCPVQDYLEFDAFVDQCEAAVNSIREYSKNIGVILGAPSRNPKLPGKALHNSAYFLFDGKIQHIVHKSCLPTYDIFDEYRYFEPGLNQKIIDFKGRKLALTIGEDLWSPEEGDLYPFCPMDELRKQHPDVMINISASPFDYDQRERRLDILTRNVQKYKLPLFYCNTVGTQTGIGFDGGAAILDAGGNVSKELPYFREALDGFELDDLYGELNGAEKFSWIHKEGNMQSLHPATGNLPVATREQLAALSFDPERHIDRIYEALVMGIRDYFDKLHFSQAVLGSSGGIDSAVALSLAASALGKEHVHAVMMPSPFSTEHSVDDAVQLAENLGLPYDMVPIKSIYYSFLDTLKPRFGDLPFGLAEENIQARIRGNLLMAMANKFGYILLNTSNKSELSVGYGTLYGDLAGGLSILGDVYKTQVYALARYINRRSELIPKSIISKSPSAELHPGQKDSDSLPEYEILDAVLFEHMEHGKDMDGILAMGKYDPAIVRKILKLFYSGEYKRHQFCPILRVSYKAFGIGRRMPITGRYPG